MIDAYVAAFLWQTELDDRVQSNLKQRAERQQVEREKGEIRASELRKELIEVIEKRLNPTERAGFETFMADFMNIMHGCKILHDYLVAKKALSPFSPLSIPAKFAMQMLPRSVQDKITETVVEPVVALYNILEQAFEGMFVKLQGEFQIDMPKLTYAIEVNEATGQQTLKVVCENSSVDFREEQMQELQRVLNLATAPENTFNLNMARSNEKEVRFDVNAPRADLIADRTLARDVVDIFKYETGMDFEPEPPRTPGMGM